MFKNSQKLQREKKKKEYLHLQFKLSSSIYWLGHVQAEKDAFIAS